MNGSGVAGYYDRLTRWNDIARAIGYGGGSEALTVHRGLADPLAGGRPTTSRLHDVIGESLGRVAAPAVLDAGCGLGGTMLALARRWGGRIVGVTLSPKQAAIAREAIARAGLAASVDVQVRSYDDPPPGPFDVVIAIESLLHSVAPDTSIGALSRVLKEGGALVIVDDMPEPAAERSHDLAAFRSGWHCGALWTRGEYLDAFARHGLRLDGERDLTPDCRLRSRVTTTALMRLNRLARLLPRRKLKLVMDSHYGGLALERLLGNGLIRYRLLIARKDGRAYS
jgi:SAM-dependent methyltransferase